MVKVTLVERPTVLLGDDDGALLNGVRRMVELEFEVVATAQDGQALLEAANTLRPDVIVADISMPLLNGFQVARLLKKDRPEVRIVFLTVHEEPVAVAEALEIGVAGYVIKRTAAADLIPAIREVLQGRNFVSPEVRAPLPPLART